MIAGALQDWPKVLLAAGGFLVLAAVAAVIIRRGVDQIVGKWGNIELTLSTQAEQLKTIDAKADAINLATNNVPKGTPPMVQRVGTLEEGHRRLERRLTTGQDWERRSLCRLADQLGVTLDEFVDVDADAGNEASQTL